jgi:hypothetical protein
MKRRRRSSALKMSVLPSRADLVAFARKASQLPTMTHGMTKIVFYSHSNRSQVQGGSFDVQILPIAPLTSLPCPYEDGTKYLRAFLYGRSRWPNQPFGKVRWLAYQAVHDSYRVDGLPRVVWALGEKARQPFLGKSVGFMRRRYQRRAKRAFGLALEQLLNESEGMCLFLHVALTHCVNVRRLSV